MKVYIADVLRKAADEFLSFKGKSSTNKSFFSCYAVCLATKNMGLSLSQTEIIWDIIEEGLRNMGVETHCDNQFNEFTSNKQKQAARYNWLYFAALIAEEQGAFVEISD